MLIKETVDSEHLLTILEFAKRQTAEIAIIPQILGYHELGDWHCAGISSNSIVATTKLDTLDNDHVVVWTTVDMPYLVFQHKDLNLFLKLITDNEIATVNIYMEAIVINGKRVCVGRYIAGDVSVLCRDVKTGENHLINPVLNLLPHPQYVEIIQRVQYKWCNARKFVLSMPLTHDPRFKEIWGAKASDGAKVWVPSECENINKAELRPYVLYLSKCMFSFGKQDSVEIQIKDDIPMENATIFMFKFIVNRRLKGSHTIINYYCTGIKL